MILVGMLLFNGFFTPAKVLAWGHLGAMAFGYGWMMLISSPKWKKFANKPVQRKRPKNKANLRIVEEDDEEKPPKYWQ